LGAQQPSFAGSMDEVAIFNQALEAQQVQQVYNAFSAAMCKPTLQGITPGPPNSTIPVGSTLQFNAVGTYSDSTTHDLTTSAIWSSSDPAIATISQLGLATGLMGGATTITATLNSLSGPTTLTVTAPSPV